MNHATHLIQADRLSKIWGPPLTSRKYQTRRCEMNLRAITHNLMTILPVELSTGQSGLKILMIKKRRRNLVNAVLQTLLFVTILINPIAKKSNSSWPKGIIVDATILECSRKQLLHFLL